MRISHTSMRIPSRGITFPGRFAHTRANIRRRIRSKLSSGATFPSVLRKWKRHLALVYPRWFTQKEWRDALSAQRNNTFCQISPPTRPSTHGRAVGAPSPGHANIPRPRRFGSLAKIGCLRRCRGLRLKNATCIWPDGDAGNTFRMSAASNHGSRGARQTGMMSQ